MEANTVTISLDRFKQLEWSEKKLNECKRITKKVVNCGRGITFYMTDDEAVEELLCDLTQCVKELQDAKSTIENIQNMSYWEFRKWKSVN